ncbi:MAG: DUF2723 domain-containing protein [Proteobacteria bacterium]|nr:DUF2723 domain-containing protein [Pseudomonadota bacterium]
MWNPPHRRSTASVGGGDLALLHCAYEPSGVYDRLVNPVDVARAWLPRGVAAAVFCLYALAAPPGLYWLDSGELAAAALGLGSPHPTGFPLYCILARTAALLPIGELGFRIELFSAACAALAVLLTARLVKTSCRDDICALVGSTAAAATLAMSLVFLRQATVIEVYAPTAALVAGSLVLLDRVGRGGGARWGLALAVLAGLGLAMHVTYAMLGPPIVALLVLRLRRGARWPLLAPLLCVTTLAALLLYLPVRSATDRVGAVDWGHPDQAERLLDHISAGRIRRAYSDQMRSTSPAVVAHNAAVFATVVSENMSPFVLLAALGGAIWLFRRRGQRWLGATLVWLAAADSIYSIWLNPMGLEDLQNTMILALVTCLGAGVGVAWFSRVLGRVGPFAGGVAVLILALPTALVALPEIWPAATSDGPRVWAEAALEVTPPHGIALVQNDSTAALLIFVTAAENARPDVAVIVRQHMADTERTLAMLARSGSPVAGFDASRPIAWMLATGRPITWEIGRDSIPAGTRLVAGAPLSRVLAIDNTSGAAGGAETARPRRSTTSAAARRLDAILSGEHDRTARRVHASALTALGRIAYGHQDLELADILFTSAIDTRPGHASAWVNRGVVASRQRDWKNALAYTERALARDPVRVGALVNAARFSLRTGDDARAEAHIDRALGLAPGRADVWALAGLVDLRAGRRERALERIQRALELDPHNPDARDIVRQLEAQRAKRPE